MEIGKYNLLKVVKSVDFGIYMDGGDAGEVLMPKRYVPSGAKPGDEIRCFVYKDSEGRLLATTEHPYATVGEFVSLRINAVNAVGAFADWGVSKELLIPHREQKSEMEVGRRYIVYIYFDQVSQRIVGTERIEKYLNNTPPEYDPGQEVDVLVERRTPLGYRVIINNLHTGLIYHNQIFQEVQIGHHLRAYVKGVREDEKIDLSLQPLGYHKMVEPVEAAILKALHLGEGFIPLSDKSDPAEVAALLQCSKKSFKKAAGALYKQGKIQITDEGIYLAQM
jgi:predicted RNA-binding protein (virulence factor B family)